MLASILIASFVLVCALTTIAFALNVIRQERRFSALEDGLENLDEWLEDRVIYAREMHVPKKYPAMRTRNAKVLR